MNQLIVKSSTDNLSAIRDFIKASASAAGISNEEIGKIILAVDEACTNIIKHAYKYSPEGNIELKTEMKGKKFKITITDDGAHFNPEKIHDPDLVEYHKNKRVGGLGMFLMKKLMDDVKYIILSDNRNQVTLIKNFN